MARTGTGSSISIRDLAEAVGVSHGTVNALLQGETRTARPEVAHRLSQMIGVDLLVLWAPTGRTVPDDAHEAAYVNDAATLCGVAQ